MPACVQMPISGARNARAPRLAPSPYRRHAQPGVHERAHQPGPDGALMIGGVARRGAAFVARRVAGLAGRERAQAERRQQAAFDGVDDAPRAIAVDQRVRQSADGEDLIRPARGIDRPAM